MHGKPSGVTRVTAGVSSKPCIYYKSCHRHGSHHRRPLSGRIQSSDYESTASPLFLVILTSCLPLSQPSLSFQREFCFEIQHRALRKLSASEIVPFQVTSATGRRIGFTIGHNVACPRETGNRKAKANALGTDGPTPSPFRRLISKLRRTLGFGRPKMKQACDPIAETRDGATDGRRPLRSMPGETDKSRSKHRSARPRKGPRRSEWFTPEEFFAWEAKSPFLIYASSSESGPHSDNPSLDPANTADDAGTADDEATMLRARCMHFQGQEN
jgi:hypothetical protein